MHANDVEYNATAAQNTALNLATGAECPTRRRRRRQPPRDDFWRWWPRDQIVCSLLIDDRPDLLTYHEKVYYERFKEHIDEMVGWIKAKRERDRQQQAERQLAAAADGGER
jgi:hypothetical protein